MLTTLSRMRGHANAREGRDAPDRSAADNPCPVHAAQCLVPRARFGGLFSDDAPLLRHAIQHRWVAHRSWSVDGVTIAWCSTHITYRRARLRHAVLLRQRCSQCCCRFLACEGKLRGSTMSRPETWFGGGS